MADNFDSNNFDFGEFNFNDWINDDMMDVNTGFDDLQVPQLADRFVPNNDDDEAQMDEKLPENEQTVDVGQQQASYANQMDINQTMATSQQQPVFSNQAVATNQQQEVFANNTNHHQQQHPSQQPNADYWVLSNTMRLQNGLTVAGTKQQLWENYQELRAALIEAWRIREMATSAAEWAHVGMQLQMEQQVQQPAYTMAPAATLSPQQRQQQQRYAYPSPEDLMFPTPAPQIPEAQYHSSSPSPTPAPTPIRAAGAKRKRAVPYPSTATPNPPTTLPAYQPSPDLNTADAARKYLSRFDTDEAMRLDILGDDVAAVEANIHVYAAKVYDALLALYDTSVDLGNRGRNDMYLEQQESELQKMRAALSVPSHLKTAKAASILLVDAAITLHKHGVSRERWTKHNNAVSRDLKPDDAWKLSTELRCSERVDAMVTAIQENKMVAKDVLEQNNLLRFAECPDAYKARKLAYLRSNKNRQNKVDERKAERRAAAGRAAKRAKGPTGRYAAVDEEDGDYEP